MTPEEWEVVRRVVAMMAFDWGVIDDFEGDSVTVEMVERAYQIMVKGPVEA